MTQPPNNPKIYHIVHLDKLSSIASDEFLDSDAAMAKRSNSGTVIGMSDIKKRRLTLPISCRRGLCVGSCVPFYFCPRSVMLYLLHKANHPNLTYRGGQKPIIHLESDLRTAVRWADANGTRWAFTLSNAGAFYFEDRCDLNQLREINWEAVQTNRWAGVGVPSEIQDGKQAEFLFEGSFPWHLIERIGVYDRGIGQQVANTIRAANHRPRVEIKPDWYY
jgi:hypothetical protein